MRGQGDENDDDAFLQVMWLAIDWGLDITDEQLERYLALINKEDES